MNMIQVRLQRGDTFMTAWVEYKPSIKKGAFISLKPDKEVFWRIIKTYSIIDSSLIHSDWEVGGLDKRSH